MTANPVDQQQALNFMRQLQALTNRVHATGHLDELLLEISSDVCEVFAAERLTIYVVGDDGREIVSRVKTGLEGFKELRIPVNDRSVAGYVANQKRLVNLRDVYDIQELAAHSTTLQFLQTVDKQTGFRAREMLAAPIVAEADGTLVGVIQLINHVPKTPFGTLAEEGIKLLAKTLAVALRQRQTPFPFTASNKYQGLVASGAIKPAALQVAVKESQRSRVDLESLLMTNYQIKPAVLGASYASFYGVPYEPFKPDRLKPVELLRSIKRDFAAENCWLPVDEGNGSIVVISPDPEKARASHTVGHVFPGRKAEFRVCTVQDFRQILDQFFGTASGVGAGESVDELLSGMGGEDEVDTLSAEEISLAQDNELVKLVNQLIVEAHKQGASDIHIEPSPGNDKTRIRFRRDGSLMQYREVPAAYRNPMVTRLKIMCDLDISERRKPQDGKIKFKKYVPGLDIELRVATIPTAGGVEDVVMRILAAGEPLPLEKLALSPHNLSTLKEVIAKPYGLFFVCGPTGSGKTTTLHSILKHLNTEETKIWTAEDPVEITQKGLRQVQVNVKAGLTFASIMRSFLRADPDIIMVGEMRDAETTGIGIEASLTGHLVLATLHTNSAPESIIRLLDMGMDPFNFADAMLGILAQRLAKRLCSCKTAYVADQHEVQQLAKEYSAELANLPAWQADPRAALAELQQEWVMRFADDAGKFTLYRPAGCDKCANTGYKGRVGLHELLVGSDAVKALIQEHARVPAILGQGLQDGMRTLKQDGIEKVLGGLTDMAQVRAVCIK
ncbi:Type II secretion system protein E [Andreprevotia sp. IGB-42]|uniref:GspE/PulE family protein n=1 Tax=Andreprevotia sp. IGB-42 TaxID=2497473 RepID=UPI00135A9ABD|nr:ATPase, T2SS/T4P/T4SS family [Andreprevotia sp. IGB-42]KAF0813968.1 Type II secretion system protein E [Andreprevotia sp. IGB-42]